jgi:hypothetical protein
MRSWDILLLAFIISFVLNAYVLFSIVFKRETFYDDASSACKCTCSPGPAETVTVDQLKQFLRSLNLDEMCSGSFKTLLEERGGTCQSITEMTDAIKRIGDDKYAELTRCVNDVIEIFLAGRATLLADSGKAPYDICTDLANNVLNSRALQDLLQIMSAPSSTPTDTDMSSFVSQCSKSLSEADMSTVTQALQKMSSCGSIADMIGEFMPNLANHFRQSFCRK